MTSGSLLSDLRTGRTKESLSSLRDTHRPLLLSVQCMRLVVWASPKTGSKIVLGALSPDLFSPTELVSVGQ